MQPQIVRTTSGNAVCHHLRPVDSDLFHAIAVGLEDHAALQRRGGIIEVQNGVRRAINAFNRAVDQMFTRLSEHLNGDIIWHMATFYQFPQKTEICLGRRGETHLDFLEPHIDQQLEHTHLASAVHRLD